MNLRKHTKKIFLLLFIYLLSLLSSCASAQPRDVTNTAVSTPTVQCSEDNPTGETNPQDAPITVTVKQNCSLGVSNYAAGMTHIDNSLLPKIGNSNAVANVQALMRGTITYENTHVMGWSAPDPWPDPTTPDPTDWGIIDQRLQHAVAIGANPVISLDEAPWWMKGQLQADGTTKLLTAAAEWNNIAYGSRILDNKMGDWLHLVQRIAERYMVAPYNVRSF